MKSPEPSTGPGTGRRATADSTSCSQPENFCVASTMTPAQKIAEIKKYGKKAKGRAELIGFYQGKRQTASQAVRAYCYDCCGYFADFIGDCENSSCPLHRFMPYAKKKVSTRTHRALSAPTGGEADRKYGETSDRAPITPKRASEVHT